MDEPLKDALAYFVESLRESGKDDLEIAERLLAAIPASVAAHLCGLPDPSAIVTIPTAARFAKVSRVTVHNWIRQKKLPVRKRQGSRRLVRLGDVLLLRGGARRGRYLLIL